MEQSQTISTKAPELKSQDFNFLREEGMSVIQALAAKTWTDHNLHDPGITILEAICYAFTETGLRAGMDVEDLIASSAVFRDPEFFTAARVLPSAPITLSDFRKVLIGHPLITNAWIFAVQSIPSGSYRALLEFSDETLNSNTIVVDVTTSSGQYIVELAFPYWNEEDVLPMQQDIFLQLVNFEGAPGNEWNNIAGSQSYFTRAVVSYMGGPDMKVWIVANIITEMNDPVTDAPDILSELLTMISTLGDNSATDMSLLKQMNRRITAAFESMRLIRRYTLRYRNLCEEFIEFNAVRLQEVSVSAKIEVGSSVNIEELLAEIYYRIYRMISPAIYFQTVGERMATDKTAELVFEGPLPDPGFLAETEDDKTQEILQTIYTSDILRIIYQLRKDDNTDVVNRENISALKILSVRNLALHNYLDNRPITQDAKDCLRLVNSKNHIPRLSVTKSRISVYRNGIEIFYNTSLVNDLFLEKLAADSINKQTIELDLPFEIGNAYPVSDYYPIQNDLPLIYGVGEAGLPDSASVQRKAQAQQLKGFMMLFEQMLAGTQEQLAAFNTFFSADPTLSTTLFQQPVYEIPQVAPLLKAYQPGLVSWDDFRADENNEYRKTLNEKIETRQQFLQRRNDMLDHLLATQGESMKDRAALLFRLATEIPEGLSLSLPALIEYQNQHRLYALQDLIDDKSAFYYDLPALNFGKAQAFGNVLWRRDDLLEIIPVNDQYGWVIRDGDGNPVFHNVELVENQLDARRVAEQVIKLATNADRYTIRLDGADRILEIRTSLAADPLAESVVMYASDPLAIDGINDTVELVKSIWLKFDLIPLECRLYHMLGIDIKERRILANIADDYIQIYDEVDLDPFIEKRFTLWSGPGFSGSPLLESVNNYLGASNQEALDAAGAAVQQMIRYGIETRNYVVENPSAGIFQVALMLPDGTALARSATLGTFSAAQDELQRIRLHIYRLFSTQGIYLLENFVLFPKSVAGQELIIQDVDDPYSLQMTFVLPSGFARSTFDPLVSATPEPIQPDLYRNLEFRKYAEDQIRRSCPSSIVPRILWVDRTTPGETVNPTDPSLEAFEKAYHAWLTEYLSDEAEESVIAPLRDSLAEVVNALYAEYYAN